MRQPFIFYVNDSGALVLGLYCDGSSFLHAWMQSAKLGCV